MKTLIESFVGSAGILVSGLVTIPLAAHLAGAEISIAASAKMSLLFFVGRWLWLGAVRYTFARRFAG